MQIPQVAGQNASGQFALELLGQKHIAGAGDSRLLQIGCETDAEVEQVNQSVVEELAAYETNSQPLEIASSGAARAYGSKKKVTHAALLQYVRELIDLFDCVLGNSACS